MIVTEPRCGLVLALRSKLQSQWEVISLKSEPTSYLSLLRTMTCCSQTKLDTASKTSRLRAVFNTHNYHAGYNQLGMPNHIECNLFENLKAVIDMCPDVYYKSVNVQSCSLPHKAVMPGLHNLIYGLHLARLRNVMHHCRFRHQNFGTHCLRSLLVSCML